MNSFSHDLLFEVCCMAAVATLIAIRSLPLGLALAIVAIRFALPTIYFAWYFDGAWTMLDDLTYLEHGGRLLDLGYHPLSLITDSQAYETTCALIGGRHIMYVWWNFVAQYLFGEHYFSPVLMNVALTFVAAECLGRLAIRCGASEPYRMAIQAFFLVHWDVVAWSTVMNLKDILVLTLTLATMHRGVCLLQQRTVRDAVALVALGVSFFWLRFYVPLTMMLAAGIWIIGIWNDARKFLLWPFIIAACYFCSHQAAEYSDYFSSDGFGINVMRFMLTPIPWSIAPGYEFATIPSVLHWLMFAPAFAGGFLLWNESRFARLPLVYFLIATCLYAMTDDLLGPRHRLQIAFVLIWTQFHLLWRLRRGEFSQAENDASAFATDTRPTTAFANASAA